MKQKTEVLLLSALLAGSAFAQLDIPNAGRIRIDGNLSDWRYASWIPIESVITGTPTNISNAVWSLSWDEDGIIYIAVQYDDSDVVLKKNANMFDCIELYARGDTGSDPLDFYKTQTSAQSYLFGLYEDQTTEWLQMGPFKELPKHNPINVAVTLGGNHFIYEAAVQLYDTFDPKDENESSESEIYAEREIAFDIAIIDVGKDGSGGILGYNDRKKRAGADQIAEHTLEE
ncbi:MAG: hypothetical protein H8E68_00940 [Kiritimatiellaeota bacterium]|nr:hypothetical protein [Kiritimatiellota bacterium]